MERRRSVDLAWSLEVRSLMHEIVSPSPSEDGTRPCAASHCSSCVRGIADPRAFGTQPGSFAGSLEEIPPRHGHHGADSRHVRILNGRMVVVMCRRFTSGVAPPGEIVSSRKCRLARKSAQSPEDRLVATLTPSFFSDAKGSVPTSSIYDSFPSRFPSLYEVGHGMDEYSVRSPAYTASEPSTVGAGGSDSAPP